MTKETGQKLTSVGSHRLCLSAAYRLGQQEAKFKMSCLESASGNSHPRNCIAAHCFVIVVAFRHTEIYIVLVGWLRIYRFVYCHVDSIIYIDYKLYFYIYIYIIYVVAVLLHIESRCRLDLRNNSLHHFIIHRNLRLNSSKSN